MRALDPQPLALGLVLLVAFLYFAGLWWASPGRPTWFAMFAALTSPIVGGSFVLLSTLDPSTWRAEALMYLAMELPFAFVVAAVCLAQAGLVPGRRAAAMGEVAKHPWLRSVLAVAPAVLLGSWVLAAVAGVAHPVPALQSFSPAPPEFLAFKGIVVLPQIFYSGLAAWLFLGAAGPTAPAFSLRLKNFCFSVGTFSWVLLALNSSAHALERVLFPDGTREVAVATHLVLEPWLLAASALAFACGLSLVYAPVVDELLLRRLYLNFFGLRDRFESLRWHLVRGARPRGLIRVLHYARDAASRLDMPEHDTERTLTALQLARILGASSTNPEHVFSRTAEQLHPLQKEATKDRNLASTIRWPRSYSPDAAAGNGLETLASDPFPEALAAAMLITHTVLGEADADGLERTLWYHLTVVAAKDAGVVPGGWPDEAPENHLLRHKAQRAYQDAKTAGKRTRAGAE